MNVNNYLEKKFSDRNTRLSKRKRIEKTFNNTTEVEKPEPEEVNCLTLKVRSSDGKKKYSVDIGYRENGIYFQCSCGEQFGLKEARTSCRHVATAVLQMNKVFLDNHIKDGKAQAVDPQTLSQIVSLLEKFEI